jgi:thiol-disulfide isomerase/thioredoxin
MIAVLFSLTFSVFSADAAPLTHSTMVQSLGPVVVGQPLPTFAGYTASGDSVRSKDILNPHKKAKPKAVIISMFTTYCEPCRIGLPIIDAMASDGAEPVTAVYIAVGEDKRKVTPFVKSLALKSMIIPDQHSVISKRLGVGAQVPRTFVVDNKGIVVAIFETEGDDFRSRLKSILSKL